MLRLLAILCILLHGWLAVGVGPLAASCAGCVRPSAGAETTQAACCECCPGGTRAVEATCCCETPANTPQAPAPSPARELLEQLGRLAVAPVSLPPLMARESEPMLWPAETMSLATPSAHLARVMATTHLLV